MFPESIMHEWRNFFEKRHSDEQAAFLIALYAARAEAGVRILW